MAEVRDGWDSRQRFHTEALAAAALNHPNIIAVHDSGDHAGTPYIVMQRLPGWTLADEASRAPLPQAQVRAVLDGVLSAVAAAHAAGILHRDIKPANIPFTSTGRVKVAD